MTREELLAMVGTELAPGPWLRIDQERIDRFAEATGDRQWIHVDPEGAAKGPFGATVAHGHLTLSLLPHLASEVVPRPEGTVLAINYGLDRVRFLEPVTVGSELRARPRIVAVREKGPGRILVTTEVEVELRGRDKPALVAETLILYVLGR